MTNPGQWDRCRTGPSAYGIGTLESIPGLHKSLKVRAMENHLRPSIGQNGGSKKLNMFLGRERGYVHCTLTVTEK